ncbi:hypothetical protein Xkoz_02371 [Xenorhabdus kozodoii]|uniref:Uncharacterized protein n=1 Tax=Xenorhabdus kozodoii TaxID=351676 RepID=A0A2D0L9Q2_9GAMM|nr:hypothetical protein Xkoz_02371 [Xenorhabdus kozodoii]
MREINYQMLDNVVRITIDIPSDWAQENRGNGV